MYYIYRIFFCHPHHYLNIFVVCVLSCVLVLPYLLLYVLLVFLELFSQLNAIVIYILDFKV